jgi:hypothetical protein
VTARRTLVAKFAASSASTAKVNLTVSASKFKITGFDNDPNGEIERTHLSRDAVISKEYEVTYCGDETFLYWENGQHMVMSRMRSFKLKIATDMYLHAVTTDTTTSKEISFVNSTDQLLFADFFSTTGTTADMIKVPMTPTNPGGKFDGWTINDEGLYSSDIVGEKLVELLRDSSETNFVVRAHFDVPAVPVNITIKFVTVNDGKVSEVLSNTAEAVGKVGFNSITLADEAIPSGYYLQYWLYGDFAKDANILNQDKQSTTNTVKIRLTSTDPVTMTVVVSDQQGLQEPVAAIQEMVSFEENSVQKIRMVGIYNRPDDGYEITEKGIFFTSDPNSVQYMNLENYAGHGITFARSKKADTSSLTIVKKLLTDEEKNATWFCRSFMTYTFEGKTYTVYSGVKSGTYKSLLPIQQQNG